jgi:hypothetical protein
MSLPRFNTVPAEVDIVEEGGLPECKLQSGEGLCHIVVSSLLERSDERLAQEDGEMGPLESREEEHLSLMLLFGSQFFLSVVLRAVAQVLQNLPVGVEKLTPEQEH